MKNWWKSPVLQGPENDYGEYDYLIEEIPDNNEKWEWYREECDSCRKDHNLNLVYTGYFRTMDGYDSMSDCMCWKCYLKRKITTPIKRFKKKIKCAVEARKDYCKYKKVVKNKGGTLTKELKRMLKEISKRDAVRGI